MNTKIKVERLGSKTGKTVELSISERDNPISIIANIAYFSLRKSKKIKVGDIFHYNDKHYWVSEHGIYQLTKSEYKEYKEMPFDTRQFFKLQSRQDFISFLRETLIPDLIESGKEFTANDFEVACLFMENAR